MAYFNTAYNSPLLNTSEGGVETSVLYAAYLRDTDGSPAMRLGEGQPMAREPDGVTRTVIPRATSGRIEARLL